MITSSGSSPPWDMTRPETVSRPKCRPAEPRRHWPCKFVILRLSAESPCRTPNDAACRVRCRFPRHPGRGVNANKHAGIDPCCHAVQHRTKSAKRETIGPGYVAWLLNFWNQFRVCGSRTILSAVLRVLSGARKPRRTVAFAKGFADSPWRLECVSECTRLSEVFRRQRFACSTRPLVGLAVGHS